MIRSHQLRSRLLAGLIAAGTLFGATACESSTAARTGEMRLLLTDAPGDVVTAVVTIDRIYLQPGEEGNDGRIVLRDEDVTTDLLTLAGTTMELIDGAEIPVGEYSQLRFVITGAYIEVEQGDGSTRIYASSPTYEGLPVGATVFGSLQMPSLAQSGLKVTLPDDAVVITEDDLVTVLVDFDVSQSFGQEAGGSGQWVMHPVLLATIPPTL